MSKHRVLSFKPQLRLEWRGQDGQNETEQPDHSASLGDSITTSTRIRFSVQTARLMVFKLVIAASKTWRRLKGTNHLPKIVAGVRFKDGIEVLEAPANHAA
jgi:hypothetical protein